MPSAFYEDETRRDSFFQGRVEPPAQGGEITCIDWDWATGNDTAGIEHQFQPEQDLQSDPDPQLRIIFAPLDLPGNAALRPLFDRYKIPAAFIRERLHNVTYGSGSETCSDGFQLSWFHYLCKSIDVALTRDSYLQANSLRIVDYHDLNPNTNARTNDQSNWTWLKSSFFLRWVAPDTQQNTSQDGEHQQVPPGASVTLICFGSSPSLLARFRRLANHREWQATLKDPYTLFTIVFEEVFSEMDLQAWNLGNVFRDIEKTILLKANERNTNSTRYDFVGLYNVTKHCTYLREAFDAALETMADISSQHQLNLQIMESAEKDAIQSRLIHQKGLFRSTNLRLESLNSRIQSITSLSFNLVTQQDSRVMWQDNQTMKAIALITLLFLPIATISTVFGCQFFGLDLNTSPPTFRVAPQIWIFAVAFVVVTVLMFPLWRMAQLRVGNLTNTSPNSNGALNGNKSKARWRLWATPQARVRMKLLS